MGEPLPAAVDDPDPHSVGLGDGQRLHLAAVHPDRRLDSPTDAHLDLLAGAGASEQPTGEIVEIGQGGSGARHGDVGHDQAHPGRAHRQPFE
ncbi:MAG: hypothetical protein R2695_10700, partial [Acidimicrobiales bacterium]